MPPAEVVAAYIKALPNWEFVSNGGRYGHIGATLTDAVFQSGIDYDTVVEPRVNRLLEQHPEATTTTAFAKLLEHEGVGSVLRWKSPSKKVTTLLELIALLQREGIETEDDLRFWLALPPNIIRLQRIAGIKDKTSDYLQILVGMQGIAIDRHLQNFLKDAGVPCHTYKDARQVLDEVARAIKVDAADLDYSIWRYMSTRSSRGRTRSCASG